MPLPSIQLEETNYGTILVAVQTTIRALGLPGVDPANVVISKLGWVDVERDTFPRVIVEPRPETAGNDEGTNERDDARYPVMISLLFAGGLDDTSRDLGLHLYWREKVLRAHRNVAATYDCTLAAGNSLTRVTCEPGDVLIEAAKRQQLNGQYLLARFEVREPRT